MKNRGIKRQIIGTVVSDKMNKTVIVKVERLVMHPMYKKYVRRHAKFSAHDEENACRIGDKVLITESRHLSKTKKWRVSSIVKKAV